MGISGWVWCSSDARRTWGIWLRLKLLAIIPGSCPARLQASDAAVLITILCWPDGWPHGADSVWQARDVASQRARAAGSCYSWAGSLPKPQDLGSIMPADQAPMR